MSEKLTPDEVKELNKRMAEGNRLMDERLDKLKREHDDHKAIAAEAIKIGEAREHALQTQEQAHALDLAELEKSRKVRKDLLTLGDQRTDQQNTQLANLEAEIALLEKRTKEEAKGIVNARKMHVLAGQIASTALGVNKGWKDSWWGQVASGGMEGKLSALGKSFADALNPADLLGSVMMKIQESTMLAAFSFDNAQSSLAGATGQGTRYNDMIMDVTDSNRGFGVGIAESAAAIQGLNESMAGFTDLSNEAASAMVAQAAQLEKLGVAASTTGAINNQLMKGMGMTSSQAMAVNDDMARMAAGIGIPVGKMADEFKNAMPQLAAWGKDAPKIFKKVAAAAKGLGVEMGTLLDFSSQFDTFEGAATAVGKLNSIMGGDMLNTYDMMNASADEQTRMLLQSIDASGKQWSSMNRFEKKAYASAAGITNMAEANNLFAGGLGAYDKAQQAAKDNAVSQEELAKRTAAAVSVGEKFKMIMEAMAVAVQPLVSFMHSFMNGILAVNDATGGLLVPVVLAAVAAYSLLYYGMKGINVIAGINAVLTGKKTLATVFDTTATSANTTAEVQNTAAETQNTAATVANTAAAATNAAATQGQTLADVQNTAAETANTTATGVNTATTQAQTLAASQNTAATGVNTGSNLNNVQSTVASTTAKATNTVSTGANTVSQTANTASKNIGIVATLRLAAATAWNTVKTWASIVAERAITLGRWAMAAASGFLTSVLWSQSAAQVGVTASAAPATAGVSGFLGVLTAFAASGVGLLVIGAVVLLAMSLAVTALAAAAMVTAIVSLVKAFMDMPAAIVPALLGLGAFMALLHIFVISTAALAPVATAFATVAGTIGMGLLALAPGLLAFSVSIAVFAGAMHLFGGGAFLSMLLLALAIYPFAVAMSMAAPLLSAAAVMLAPAMVALGIGFSVLAVGLFLMLAGIPAMLLLSFALPFFAVSMMASAPLLAAAATILPGALALIGLGLAVLGLSLMLFNLKSLAVMALLGPALAVFAVGLAFATIFLGAAALTFAPAALLVGFGLMTLGLALLLFDSKTAEIMASIGLGLVLFAIGLTFAAPFLWAAAFAFAPAALAIGFGLASIGLALKLFDRKSVKTMLGLSYALVAFAIGLFFASPFIAAAASVFAPGAILLGLGLAAIGLSLKLFNRGGFKAMEVLTIAMPIFALAMGVAGLFMAKIGWAFALGATSVALGLSALGLAFKLFPDDAGTMMFSISKAIFPFALAIAMSSGLLAFAGVPFAAGAAWVALGLTAIGLAMRFFPEEGAGTMWEIAKAILPFALAIFLATPLLLAAGPFLLKAGALVGAGLYLLGSGFAVFAEPFREVAESIALMAPFSASLVELALGLLLIGPALIVFAMSLIAVGIAASLPFFSTGLGVFSEALDLMSASFENIPTEKAKAMGQFFSSLASLTNLNSVAEVMSAIAMGIWGVSAALAFLPEEKTFALSSLISSVTEATAKVTPEKVESVTGLVEQAAAYAEVQAQFKAPSVDAFVQALKQLNGDGDSGSGGDAGKSKKDIVLNLNGRELGRAIDVHLEDKHNLRST